MLLVDMKIKLVLTLWTIRHKILHLRCILLSLTIGATGRGVSRHPPPGHQGMVFTSIKVDEVERMKPLARSPRKRTAPRRLPRYAEQSRWSQLGGTPAPKCHAQHVSQKWNCRTNAHVKCRVMPLASEHSVHLPLGTRTSPHNRLLELQNQCTCQMPSVLNAIR